MAEQISLIIAPQAEGVQAQDREGGQTHGVIQKFLGYEKKIDLGKIKDNLDESMSTVSKMFEDLKQKAVAGWELESVTVSLAISAEGSIGVATAGVEASLEVTYKPK